MDALPFPDAGFDAAVGFNAFPFADDPARAVAEAARVVRPGGLVAATTFAEPERNESTALHLALEPLRARHPERRHLPYALSAPGGWGAALSAGLSTTAGRGLAGLGHPDAESAVRAVLASGGGAMAIAGGGEAAARDALERAVVLFTDAHGAVRMRNTFRYALVRRG